MTALDPRVGEIEARANNPFSPDNTRAQMDADRDFLLAELRKAHEAVADAWDKGMTFSAYLLNAEELTPTFRKDNPYRAAVAAANRDGHG